MCGIVLVILNFQATQEAVEISRQRYIDEFQPLVSVEYLGVETVGEAFVLRFGLFNKGRAVAYDLSEAVCVVDNCKDTLYIDTTFTDRLFPSERDAKSLPVKFDMKRVLCVPVVLTWQVRYWWNGEPQIKDYLCVCDITYDADMRRLLVNQRRDKVTGYFDSLSGGK